MAFKFANFAETTLSRSVSDVETGLVVPQDEALDFPALGVGDKFAAVLIDGIQEPEIVYVTGVAAGNWTALRGQEDTAAKTWQVGTKLYQILTRDTIAYIGGGMSDDTVLHLEERIDGAYAAITVETNLRVTADSAMASLITTVQTDVAGNAAAVQVIALAQSDLNTAFASLDTTVTATANNALAVANSTQTAFAGFQTAQAAINTTLTAQVGANSAAITTETSARVAGDTANASSITSLTAQVNSNTANITSETTARTNADIAIASQITTLTTNVGANTAAITSESLTRSSADSALASSITSLTATVTGNYATLNSAITTEATTRANADSALSTLITTLSSTYGPNNSINANPNFQIYTTTPGIPEGWADWASGGTGTRTTGQGGAWAYRVNVALNTDQGIQYSTILEPGWFVLEVDAALISGSWTGAGLLLASTASSSLILATEPDTNGTVSSSQTGTRRWRKLVQFTGTGAGSFYLLTNWSGFGTRPAKTVDWFRAAFRPASDQEIAAHQATLDIVAANAAITSEATTRASQDSALASSITSLTATVSGNYTTLNSAITSEATARANGDSTNASAITTLTSTVNSNYTTLNSAITSEASTRASGDSTNASAISTVSSNLTTTNGNVSALSATVTTNATTLTQVDGYAQANYSVQAAAGGYFSSFSLKAAGSSGTTGGISEFRINAIKFLVDGKYPMVYDSGTGTLKLQNIEVDGALIKNASIGTAAIGNAVITSAKIGNAEVKSANIDNLQVQTIHIANAAVTNETEDYQTGSINLTATNQTINTVNKTTTGGRVKIQVCLDLQSIGTSTVFQAGTVDVYRDSTLLRTFIQAAFYNGIAFQLYNSPSWSFTDNVGAGTYVYTARARVQGGTLGTPFTQNRYLSCEEVLK